MLFFPAKHERLNRVDQRSQESPVGLIVTDKTISVKIENAFLFDSLLSE